MRGYLITERYLNEVEAHIGAASLAGFRQLQLARFLDCPRWRFITKARLAKQLRIVNLCLMAERKQWLPGYTSV